MSNDNFTGSAEFESYLHNINPEKRQSVAVQLDAIDLSTPEGTKAAQELLRTQLDFNFRNASQVAGEAIAAVSLLLKSSTETTTADQRAGKVLYRRKIGLRDYVAVAPSAEFLTENKKQVDNIIDILKTGDRKKIAEILTPGVLDGSGSGSVSNDSDGISGKNMRGDIEGIIQLLESGQMDERRLAMLAISTLTGVNRSKGLNTGGAAIKLLKAGLYPLEKVFEKEGEATCIDVSALNKELARLFGINSDIYAIGGDRSGHRFLITETDEVIDPWTGAGVFLSRESYVQNYGGSDKEIHREQYDLEL